jgi:hypothetical protein
MVIDEPETLTTVPVTLADPPKPPKSPGAPLAFAPAKPFGAPLCPAADVVPAGAETRPKVKQSPATATTAANESNTGTDRDRRFCGADLAGASGWIAPMSVAGSVVCIGS